MKQTEIVALAKRLADPQKHLTDSDADIIAERLTLKDLEKLLALLMKYCAAEDFKDILLAIAVHGQKPHNN